MSGSSSFNDWCHMTKYTTTFHTLPDGFKLKTDILLPPNAKTSASHPLIIAYHGGGLCGGARDHYEYQSAWLPAWAGRNNAIVLSPDYRLFPQASAKDIIDDVHSLWNWVQSLLTSTIAQLAPGHHVDLSRIIVEGGSAGGFTAVHLALSHPSDIRAAILVYPMVDGFYERGDVIQKLVAAEMFLSREELHKSINLERQKKEWTVSRLPDVSGEFLISLLQDRKAYAEAFGQGDNLVPIDRIKASANGKGLPEKVWILHGREDSIIPYLYTERFAKKIEQIGWKGNLRLTTVDNEPSEHGFDGGWKVDDAKLKEHLQWIEEAWLR